MKDLTKIKTPFGLLKQIKPKIAKALEDHGGPYEIFTANRWAAAGQVKDIHPSYVIRVKPVENKSLEELSEQLGVRPPIFAAVKEWQDARMAMMKTMEKSDVFAAHDRMQASIEALEAIKVPE